MATSQAMAVFNESGELKGLQGDNPGEFWPIGATIDNSKPPTADNNASKGYTSGAIWQSGGTIYKLTDNPTTNAASWTAQRDRGTNPARVMGSAAKFAGGMLKLVATYNGNAVELTSTVSGAQVTTSVGFGADGMIDGDAVGAIVGAADQGTVVYVTKVFDQTGNSNDLSLVASAQTARGFTLIWSHIMGAWVMASDENYSTGVCQGLKWPNTLQVAENSYSAFFMGEGIGSWYYQNQHVIASFGSGTAAMSIHSSEGATGPTVAGWSTGQGSRRPFANQIAPIPTGPAIVYAVGSSANVRIGCNENSFITPAGSATLKQGGHLGAWDLNGDARFSPMRFLAVVVANAGANDDQMRRAKWWFYTRFNAKPQSLDRVVFISDSRGSVVNSTQCVTTGSAGENIAQQMARRLKADVEVISATCSGATVDFESYSVSANVLPGLVATTRQSRRNIAVVMLGVNEFIKAGNTAAGAALKIKSVVQTLTAAGWEVCVVNELTTTKTDGGASSKMPELRALIDAGVTGAKRVIDVSRFEPVNRADLTGYYPDGLHQGEQVSAIIGGEIAKVVEELLLS